MIYKKFNVLYRIQNEKVKHTEYYIAKKHIELYGKNQFYNAIQNKLECEKNTVLDFLKINNTVMINDKQKTYCVPNVSVKTTKRECADKEFFYNRNIVGNGVNNE